MTIEKLDAGLRIRKNIETINEDLGRIKCQIDNVKAGRDVPLMIGDSNRADRVYFRSAESESHAETIMATLEVFAGHLMSEKTRLELQFEKL